MSQSTVRRWELNSRLDYLEFFEVFKTEFFIYLFFVCMHGYLCVPLYIPWLVGAAEDNFWELVLRFVWIPEIESRSSDFVASAFTCLAISVASNSVLWCIFWESLTM